MKWYIGGQATIGPVQLIFFCSYLVVDGQKNGQFFAEFLVN